MFSVVFFANLQIITLLCVGVKNMRVQGAINKKPVPGGIMLGKG